MDELMLDIGELFKPSTFNAAWISALLIHIKENRAPGFLLDLYKMLTPNAVAYTGLKLGKQGETILKENKCGKPMKRTFTFWKKDNFNKLLSAQGFRTIHFRILKSGQKRNDMT